MNDKLREKTISVAYSDAGIVDRLVVYWTAMYREEVKAMLEEYRITAKEVHHLEEDIYPGERIEMIFKNRGIKKNDSLFQRFYTFIFNGFCKS